MTRLGVLGIILVTVVAGRAYSQHLNGGLGDDLRLQGIVDPSAGVTRLGTLTIRAGEQRRIFAVADVRTSVAEGMSVLRLNDYPGQLQLVGSPRVLQPFQLAPPQAALRIVGLLQPDTGAVLVSHIESVEAGPGSL